MSSKVRRTLFSSTASWLKRGQHANDRERALASAEKLRFWITAWDFIKSRSQAEPGEWIQTGDLVEATGRSTRSCRRLMFRFAAAGLCELEPGTRRTQSRIRLVSAIAIAREATA